MMETFGMGCGSSPVRYALSFSAKRDGHWRVPNGHALTQARFEPQAPAAENGGGSTLDIAGKGLADPLGSLLIVAMLLRLTLNRPEDANLLEKAVATVLAVGARTAEIVELGVKKLTTE
jgi:isocitrate/isopropylmalate dehydrogenase